MLDWDIVTSIACLTGGITCVYLMQVILREHTPAVHLQRLSLAHLALALLNNALAYYPEWDDLVMGHRPSGIWMVIAVAINLVVMAARGHVMYQHSFNHHYPTAEQ